MCKMQVQVTAAGALLNVLGAERGSSSEPTLSQKDWRRQHMCELIASIISLSAAHDILF